jgi:hypothetical protein
VEHWDGNSWSVIPIPDIGGAHLTGVTALTGNDVWAVGYDYPGYDISFTLHWDGNSWRQTLNPNPQGLLYDVEAVSAEDVWAVGSYNGVTRALHYSNIVCNPTPEPPRCPGERFTDVCPSDYFYQHVLDLNDLGILSGYNTTPPCDGPDHIPCFKPYNWSTRGQIAKVVSLSAGFNDPVTSQSFEDVPPAHTFYQYIERMASRDIISGYPCGGPGEPCGSGILNYFRPGNTVGRGQLSKMTALAFGFNQPVSTQTFEDVPPGYTFYEYIERLAVLNIINGYDCGNPEPCIPPDNRPYFRPGNNISRGQIAKIVNLARLQALPTPTGTLTPIVSKTPNVTVTPTPVPTDTPKNTTTPSP